MVAGEGSVLARSVPAGAVAAEGPHYVLAGDADSVVLRLAGDWLLTNGGGTTEAVRVGHEIAARGFASALRFEAGGLGRWDTVLPTFLVEVVRSARQAGLEVDLSGLPEGAVRLVRLATAVPQHDDVDGSDGQHLGQLERLGAAAISTGRAAADVVTFVGEVALALARLVRGRARMRGRDFALVVQQVGAGALPIVTLISVLVGMILAFIGGAQLSIFGAQIYVANLVALGMAREMGAMMAAVIMAGRTGAAFAAELGTMQVNEEIDALRTLGIQPMEFLVLPRLLALTLMMPLLAIYADLFGILGGGIVGVGLFDVSPRQYFYQSLEFVGLKDFAGGLAKAGLFGVVVAGAGCLQGIRSGRDAAAVGASTTAAVVNGIVAVIVCDCLLNVVYHAVGI